MNIVVDVRFQVSEMQMAMTQSLHIIFSTNNKEIHTHAYTKPKT